MQGCSGALTVHFVRMCSLKIYCITMGLLLAVMRTPCFLAAVCQPLANYSERELTTLQLLELRLHMYCVIEC
eukprot:17946-Heterococcus_DN1.PRE.2